MIVSLRPNDSLRMCLPVRISAPLKSACDRSRGVMAKEAGLRGYRRNPMCAGHTRNIWLPLSETRPPDRSIQDQLGLSWFPERLLVDVEDRG